MEGIIRRSNSYSLDRKTEKIYPLSSKGQIFTFDSKSKKCSISQEIRDQHVDHVNSALFLIDNQFHIINSNWLNDQIFHFVWNEEEKKLEKISSCIHHRKEAYYSVNIFMIKSIYIH